MKGSREKFCAFNLFSPWGQKEVRMEKFHSFSGMKDAEKGDETRHKKSFEKRTKKECSNLAN